MAIFVAVDDSKFSEAAANDVIAQVKATGTEVKLLCVIGPIPLA